jgi:hypothetical protein
VEVAVAVEHLIVQQPNLRLQVQAVSQVKITLQVLELGYPVDCLFLQIIPVG